MKKLLKINHDPPTACFGCKNDFDMKDLTKVKEEQFGFKSNYYYCKGCLKNKRQTKKK
jgi:hypothetical protein